MANLSNINNKFLVTTGGNVLIGQTSAVGSSILQVTGNVNIGSSLSSEKLEVGGTIRIRVPNTSSATLLLNNTDTQLSIENTGGNMIFTTAGAAERMRIDSSGNSTFSGSVNITGGTTNGLNITTSGTQDTININRAANNDNAITKYQTASADKWIVGLRNTGDDNFRFYSYGTSTDVLTINQANGNSTFVGDISSSVSSKSIRYFRRWYMDANNDFGINNNAGTSTLFYMNSSASVGIGTTTINTTLNLYSASNTQIGFQDASTGVGTADGFRVGYNGTYGQMWLFENAPMRFATNNTQRMTITNSGVVEIKNTGAAHLILNGDTNNTGDVGNVDGIIDFRGDGNPGPYGYRINTENWSGQTALNFQEYINGSYTSRLFISKDGNVGIGTSSPSGVKFQTVQTGTGWTGDFKNSTANGYGLRVDMSGSSSVQAALQVYTGTGVGFKVTNRGKVGIGTGTPGTFLQLGSYPVSGTYVNNATYPDVPSEHMIHLTAPSTTGYFGGGISFGENAFTAANITAVDAGGGGALHLAFGTGNSSGMTERMRITNTGAISVGSSGTAYGAAGEVLTSNGNTAPSWQAAGGGGSAWPQEKFAEYTIDSTTSNILIATMNPSTWHGNELAGCLKFTINASDYIQVSYITVSTFLSGTNQWFFKGNSEMTTRNNGTNPIRYVFAFAGNNGSFGTTCTLKINRVSNTTTYTKVNVLVQAISSPDMFILN